MNSIKAFIAHRLFLTGLLALLGAPAFAAVQILSMTPSVASPQVIGTPVTWTVTAVDTASDQLTFQFNVVGPGTTSFALVKDFNVGTLKSGIWTSQPFVWVPTDLEGIYGIQVVIKDFTTGETAKQTSLYTVSPLVTGSAPVAVKTANPLVALFSAPSCAAGSTMRASFQEQSNKTPATLTGWSSCHPPSTMTFEIAGMYPTTGYNMFAQTMTAGKITDGPTVTFTTGSLPKSILFPTFTVNVPAGSQTDTAAPMLLLNPTRFGDDPVYPNVATDLSGKIMWYYSTDPPQALLLTRPLPTYSMLTIQSGPAWNPATHLLQLLRQIDLAGNIKKETNTGVIQAQLVQMGATDGGPCTIIPSPAPVGAACLDGFRHDAIQTLPNGYTAVIADTEKIFPAGTQGDTSGLPVDIMGEMILVLDTNWQLVWYFDSFQHDGGCPTGGGPCQLDINRAAVLAETCVVNEQGCPALSLLGTGIAPTAKDWLHANALYYYAQDNDIIWSSRHQDWAMRIDYSNGAGNGNLLWRMGPCGDYTINNVFNDPWPWFSHQHDIGIQNNGAGPMTMFDNGNTRVSPPTGVGSSTGCLPGIGPPDYSRGMAVTFDETTLEVTPVLSVDLGSFSGACGSAQLLSDGNYYFLNPMAFIDLNEFSQAIEIVPAAGTGSGTPVLNIQGPNGYRGWQMPSLYQPPAT